MTGSRVAYRTEPASFFLRENTTPFLWGGDEAEVSLRSHHDCAHELSQRQRRGKLELIFIHMLLTKAKKLSRWITLTLRALTQWLVVFATG